MSLTWDIGPRTYPMTLAVRGVGRPEESRGHRAGRGALARSHTGGIRRRQHEAGCLGHHGLGNGSNILAGHLCGVGAVARRCWNLRRDVLSRHAAYRRDWHSHGARRRPCQCTLDGDSAGDDPGGIGIGIGLLGASFATSLMKSMLFGVKPNDPVTLALASALMAAVALGRMLGSGAARHARRTCDRVALRIARRTGWRLAEHTAAVAANSFKRSRVNRIHKTHRRLQKCGAHGTQTVFICFG